jgi:hypothetical protein
MREQMHGPANTPRGVLSAECGSSLRERPGTTVMRQKELRDRRLFHGRRIGPAQLFIFLFLVHLRIGDSEQLIE